MKFTGSQKGSFIWLLWAASNHTSLGKKESSAVVLTKSNFEELTKGKTVFIKFFAPWCGHCQELAPEWEKLALEWKGHDQGLVGEVDCTVEKELCEKQFNIQGLPTLKFGDPSYGGIFLEEPYFEEKVFPELSTFAKENNMNLPMCSPGNLDACQDEGVRNWYQKLFLMSLEELDAEIASKEKEIKNAEEKFRDEFKKMQTAYDALANKNEIESLARKQQIKLLKEILAQKQ